MASLRANKVIHSEYHGQSDFQLTDLGPKDARWFDNNKCVGCHPRAIRPSGDSLHLHCYLITSHLLDTNISHGGTIFRKSRARARFSKYGSSIPDIWIQVCIKNQIVHGIHNKICILGILYFYMTFNSSFII